MHTLNNLEEFAEFAEFAATLGCAVTPGQSDLLDRFKENLLLWNTKFNLTAIKDEAGIWQKHFADSATIVPLIPDKTSGKTRLLDVGSGAGFPGMVAAILRPDVRVTLLEATGKKTTFLADCIARLGLPNVDCVHARAEEINRKPPHRAAYDVVTARAVARMDKLAAWCLPLVKPGGVWLAMKGPDVTAELADAEEALAKHGGRVAEIRTVTIVPGMVHSIVVVAKGT